MNSNMKKLLIPGLLLATAGVFTYLGRQFYLLYKAAFKVVKVKIGNITLSNTSLTIYAEIDNKGDVSAKVKNQHYDVTFNGKQVSTIDSKNEIHINSRGKTVIPIAISFSPANIVKIGSDNILDLIADRSKLILEVKGYLSLSVGIVTLKHFPVYFKYTLQELIDISKTPSEPTT